MKITIQTMKNAKYPMEVEDSITVHSHTTPLRLPHPLACTVLHLLIHLPCVSLPPLCLCRWLS